MQSAVPNISKILVGNMIGQQSGLGCCTSACGAFVGINLINGIAHALLLMIH